jgi:hypothetical protein
MDITDIVETLRECAEDSRKVKGDYYADQFATDASVFDDAADEIERLRPAYATAVQRLACEIARLRLTDEEREAIEYGVLLCEATAGCANDRPTIDGASRAADVLRGLLERTK